MRFQFSLVFHLATLSLFLQLPSLADEICNKSARSIALPPGRFATQADILEIRMTLGEEIIVPGSPQAFFHSQSGLPIPTRTPRAEIQIEDLKSWKTLQLMPRTLVFLLAQALRCPKDSKLSQEVQTLLEESIELPGLPQAMELAVGTKLLSLEDLKTRRSWSDLIHENTVGETSKLGENSTENSTNVHDEVNGVALRRKNAPQRDKWLPFVARDPISLQVLKDGIGLEQGTADFLVGRFYANLMRDLSFDEEASPTSIPKRKGYADSEVEVLEKRLSLDSRLQHRRETVESYLNLLKKEMAPRPGVDLRSLYGINENPRSLDEKLKLDFNQPKDKETVLADLYEIYQSEDNSGRKALKESIPESWRERFHSDVEIAPTRVKKPRPRDEVEKHLAEVAFTGFSSPRPKKEDIEKLNLTFIIKSKEDLLKYARAAAKGHPSNRNLLNAHLDFQPRNAFELEEIRRFLLYQVKQLQEFENTPLLLPWEQRNWNVRYSLELALLRALRLLDGGRTSLLISSSNEEGEEERTQNIDNASQPIPSSPRSVLEKRKALLKQNPPVPLRETHQKEVVELEKAKKEPGGENVVGEIDAIANAFYENHETLNTLERIDLLSMAPRWRTLLAKSTFPPKPEKKEEKNSKPSSQRECLTGTLNCQTNLCLPGDLHCRTKNKKERNLIATVRDKSLQTLVDYLTHDGQDDKAVMQVIAQDLEDAGLQPPTPLKPTKSLTYQEKEVLLKWVHEKMHLHLKNPISQALEQSLSVLAVLLDERGHFLRNKENGEVPHLSDFRYSHKYIVAIAKEADEAYTDAAPRRKEQLEALSQYFHAKGSNLPTVSRLQFLKLTDGTADALMHLKEVMEKTGRFREFEHLALHPKESREESLTFDEIENEALNPPEEPLLAAIHQKLKTMQPGLYKTLVERGLLGKKSEVSPLPKWLVHLSGKEPKSLLESPPVRKELPKRLVNYLKDKTDFTDWDLYTYNPTTLEPLTEKKKQEQREIFTHLNELEKLQNEKNIELDLKRIEKRTQFMERMGLLTQKIHEKYPTTRDPQADPKSKVASENLVKRNAEIEKIIKEEAQFDKDEKKEIEKAKAETKKHSAYIAQMRAREAAFRKANLHLLAKNMADQYLQLHADDNTDKDWITEAIKSHYLKLKAIENGLAQLPADGPPTDLEKKLLNNLTHELLDTRTGMVFDPATVSKTVTQMKQKALIERQITNSRIAQLTKELEPVGIRLKDGQLDFANAKLWLLSQYDSKGELKEESKRFIQSLRELGKLSRHEEDGYNLLVKVVKVQTPFHQSVFSLNPLVLVELKNSSEHPVHFKPRSKEALSLQEAADRSIRLLNRITKMNRQRTHWRTGVDRLYRRDKYKNGEFELDAQVRWPENTLQKTIQELLEGGDVPLIDPVSKQETTSRAYGQMLAKQAEALQKGEAEILSLTHQQIDTVRDARVNGGIIAGEMAVFAALARLTNGKVPPALLAKTRLGQYISRFSRLAEAGKASAATATVGGRTALTAQKLIRFIHHGNMGALKGAGTMVVSNEAGQLLVINPYMKWKFHYTKNNEVGPDGRLLPQRGKKMKDLEGYMDRDRDGKIDAYFKWILSDPFTIVQKLNHGYRTFAIAHALPGQNLPVIGNFHTIFAGALLNEGISKVTSNATPGTASDKFRAYIKPKNLAKETLHAAPTAIWGLPFHNIATLSKNWTRLTGYSVNAGVNAGTTALEHKYMNHGKTVINDGFVTESIPEAIFLRLAGTFYMDFHGARGLVHQKPRILAQDILRGKEKLVQSNLLTAIHGARMLPLKRTKEFDSQNEKANRLVKEILPRVGITGTKSQMEQYLKEYWQFTEGLKTDRDYKNPSVFDSVAYFSEKKADVIRSQFSNIKPQKVDEFLDKNMFFYPPSPERKLLSKKAQNEEHELALRELEQNRALIDMPLRKIPNNKLIYGPLLQRVAELRASRGVLPQKEKFIQDFMAFKNENRELSLREYISYFTAQQMGRTWYGFYQTPFKDDLAEKIQRSPIFGPGNLGRIP